MKSKYLPTGTYSEATLNPASILEELLWSAEAVSVSAKDRATLRRIQEKMDATSDSDDETLSGLLQEAEEALEPYVPPFCDLGMHHSDGACYGCWPNVEAAQGDDDVVVVEAGEPGKRGKLRLAISDHGNATLYDPQGREIWGVV